MPGAETFAAVTSPVDRARLLTKQAGRDCTLTPELAAMRREAIAQARASRQHTMAELARHLRISVRRLYQILASGGGGRASA